MIDLSAITAPAAGLHIVATPIGNLGDITLRALVTLAHADVIYCEDTRHSRRLLDHFGVTAQTRAYHDHNAEKMRPMILAELAQGRTIALISDAGTPLVSDPGYKLVREALEAGHAVTVEPGASAVMAALVMSGLPTDRFLFAGFLPARAAARRSAIAALANTAASLVLFEAPSRLAATLADLAQALGPRPAAVARELTKLHEEVRRGPLTELASQIGSEPAQKGELVIVIGPPLEAAVQSEDLDRALAEALKRQSLKAAVAEVAECLGLPRRAVYTRALALVAAGD